MSAPLTIAESELSVGVCGPLYRAVKRAHPCAFLVTASAPAPRPPVCRHPQIFLDRNVQPADLSVPGTGAVGCAVLEGTVEVEGDDLSRERSTASTKDMVVRQTRQLGKRDTVAATRLSSAAFLHLVLRHRPVFVPVCIQTSRPAADGGQSGVIASLLLAYGGTGRAMQILCLVSSLNAIPVTAWCFLRSDFRSSFGSRRFVVQAFHPGLYCIFAICFYQVQIKLRQ
ncbi:hypothetical protein CMQ_5422 [Grosmannia clavigera kw1407]|uniref:Uncharacterized protein n=1 Tax=Grosmannia clavigera (strain kw1407 / UAMH 11150) TaxID=655863 RepID=F0XG03_GROCL|nr:uncharacterized protein CMQ_5422 [Grosmannia clavigera kw1407]EFX03372.1 hypothetical protein CMQ_5422 [Grosmannia clavigera kw1407]